MCVQVQLNESTADPVLFSCLATESSFLSNVYELNTFSFVTVRLFRNSGRVRSNIVNYGQRIYFTLERESGFMSFELSTLTCHLGIVMITPDYSSFDYSVLIFKVIHRGSHTFCLFCWKQVMLPHYHLPVTEAGADLTGHTPRVFDLEQHSAFVKSLI